jgi:hypothetical protein
MKRPVLHFSLSAIMAYVAFGFIGLAATPSLGPPLSVGEAETALAFSFPDEGRDWTESSGHASHGWLYRRAYVEGTSRAGVRRSEQVLKVGWPFTVVRGFVRGGDGEPGNLGVAWTSPASRGEPARLLPVQPVWPGLAFFGFLGALLLGAISWRRPARTRT